MFSRAPPFEAHMILQKPDLEQRLKWNLDRAISVDIATAFIGEPSSNLLKTVADYPHRIRVVVGTMSQGRSADGDRRRAIRSWARKGVSIREHNGSLHAKTYIFHHRDGARAWVGSNNLTTSAFRDNDELTLETSDQHDIEELESWFDNRWKASASRKVRSHPSKSDLLGDAPFATPVRFISDGREIDCRFAAVYMTASNTPSIYWCTTQTARRGDARTGCQGSTGWTSREMQ